MWISFAWTTDALLAMRKSCTRRNWTDDYAAKFIKAYERGEPVDAYNRNPRNGGKKVGQIRLTCAPYKQWMGKFPAVDYENEGFKWMEEHNLKIQGLHPMEFCQNWINTNDEMWVVRFGIIRIDAPKCPKQYMDFDNCIAQNKRVAEAQLAHDKTRIQTLEIDYQMLSEEAKGLSDENKELKATSPSLPSEGRIEEMLNQGKRVRLWYGQRFLDRDCISNDWIVMDSQGNKGLGDCLYSGTNLGEALDALEAKP